MTSKTKYIVIVLLLLVLATTSVGLSTWNIHYQAIVGDIDFTAKEPGTQDSILNRYIYFTPAKDTNGNIATDAEGNITTKKQNYPIGRGGEEDIFTYIYDAYTHTPTVFVPSEGNVKGSDNYPTDLFLADGALDSELVWGIGDVFGEIEFKYEYRLIAMPYVSEDYKGKSENFCEITAIEYYENKINVYLTWKNGNNGNNQGENVLVELLLSGGNYTENFNVSVPGDLSEKEIENITKKITVTNAGGQLTVGVNGFTPFPIVTAQNGWVTYAPSNAGVYQCRITAQLKDGASGNIDTANQAIEQLNSLAEGEINYAAQVTYAILPRNSEMAQIGYSYEKSSATEQQIKARRNLANTMPLAESAEVTTDEDGLHTINGNSNSFYVTYGGVGFEISITSTFETLDGSADVSFPISEYLFTNANALKELLADGQTWDQNENHYYTTYGFSPDPNYQITNPEVHYTILRREVQIDNWTTTDLVYNGTAQSQSAHTNNSYDSTFDYSWTKADDTELDSAPIDAGSYKVWASVGENYYLSCVEGAGTLDETSGKVFFDYTIAPKPVDITWTNTDTLVYNGSAQAPTATANGLCTRDGAVDICTVTVTGAQTNAGTHTATAIAVSNSNYKLPANATTTFTIAKAENKITSLTITGWTYGQNANSPNIQATYTTGVVYTYSTAQDGEYAATVPTNAGTYYIKAEIPESANYLAATATTAKFVIAKAENKITSLTIANWTFGQNANSPNIQATYTTGVVYTYSADGTTFTSAVPTNAGTYTIKAEIPESDNYLSATAKTATFTINKAPNAIVWGEGMVIDAENNVLVGWTFGSEPVAHSATAAQGGGVTITYYRDEACTDSIKWDEIVNAGTYYAKAVSQDSGSNYRGTSSVMSFAITPATLVGATVTLQNHENLVYDGTTKTVAIKSVVLANGTVLAESIYNVTGLTATNAGTHTVTVTAPNYEGSATAEFVIAQKELTLTWGNTSFTYNGSAQAPTVTVNGVVSGDNYVVTVEGAQTNAGNYTATAKAPAGGNYKISGSTTVNFSIAQASVTSANCTTNDIFEGEAIKLTGTTANGVTINSTVESVSGTYTISDASNAVFSDTGESSQTVGKTIKVLFTPSNGNYKATILDVTVNVKAVAYIKNGNYFGNLPAAVESAKNGTNKTVIVIVGTTINISENLTLDNSITVKVPYDGETTMATVTSGTAALKSTINFTNAADLIINNGSTLELGGQIGTKGIIGSYCQINLGVGSSITVNGSFNAYGYVKETNPVTGISNSSQVIYDNSTDSERYILVSSTGYIITPFKTDDISSGTTLTGKVEANICPTYNFQFHALQTYVVVETGGILASTAYVQISGQNAEANVGIIYPATSSTESMFYQESGTISIEWCSSSKTIIYISGSAKMGKIYISARGYPIDSDDMFIPIHSRFSIYIGGTMDTNGKKIKFLPGSYVEVLKGGSFNVNGTSSSPSKVIIYPLSAMTGLGLTGYSKDAEFVNNGTVTLNSYGSMGGVVNTNVTDGSAIVDLSNITSADNLSVTDVEWVSGKAVNIADVALTGPFYDETTQSTEMSLFSHGSAINSHPEMSCWVGAIVLMDDITLTVLKTGVPTEAFNYTIYTNSTASDSGQYEQIPSNTSTRSQSFSLKRGTYIKIEDIVSTAIAINGEAYTSGTWIQVSGPMAIEITPTASFTVTAKHTVGTSGAGNIKRSITYGPNESSMTEVVSTEAGQTITAKIPMGWVFKVADNSSVKNGSKIIKTTYSDDGTKTETILKENTGSSKVWNDSDIWVADGDYQFIINEASCFAPGTLITMADGSLVAIENLKPGDFVLSYDFETGSFVPTIVAEVTNHGITEYRAVTLRFDDNSTINIIEYHGFFDVTEMRYLDISADNYQDYIGHEFMAYDGNGNVVIKRLVSATVTTETTSAYTLTAAVYINAIADGLITITPPMTNWYNMFDVDENFKWNEQLMAQDIDKYGLFTYAEVESMIPYEIFVASNFRYFKVAMAKGLVTMAEIEEFVAWYNELIESGEIVLGDMSQFLPPQENTNTTDAVEATLPPPVVTGSDDNSGDGDGSSDEDTSE